MSKTNSNKTAASNTSPVKEARNVPQHVRERLLATTAGRCEFRGCNKPLYFHALTKADGNYAEAAHIVAFQEDGPRGTEVERPKDINAFNNLMLLCKEDHHLIDTTPKEYTVPVLRGYKAEHEERIAELTEIKPELKTCVIQLRATIGGQHVDIPAPEVRAAVAPRYVADQRGHVIDLTGLSMESPQFFEQARQQIRQDLRSFLRGGIEGQRPKHFSVFALAPIPVLAAFGRELGDKLSVDLYQRHRDEATNPWKWKVDGEPVDFEFRELRSGDDKKRAGLLLSISGTVELGSLPAEIDASFSLYEIRPKEREPSRSLVRLREDLVRFRKCYQASLASIMRAQPAAQELCLFPAIPAPAAIACGQDLLPKVHPDIVVFDNVKGTFRRMITINSSDAL